MRDDLKERLPRLLADLRGDFHGTVADAALRRIDDAAQAHLVARVADHAEVSDHFADLAALVEACAADDAVRNARLREVALEHHRLGVHPVQNGIIREFAPGGHAVEDDLPDAFRFVHLVFGGVQVDLRAGAVLRPERFALALRVVFDDGVRRVQNILGRAVVLLQPDDLRVLEGVFKAQDVFYCRAAELVDALVVVADHAEILVLFRKQAHERVLRVVCVLVFVDHQIFEAVLVILEYVRAGAEQLDGLVDQVVEVHRVRVAQTLLVQLIGAGDNFLAEIVTRRLFVFLRRDEGILCAGDFVQHGLWRRAFFGDVQLLQNVLHQTALVVRIVDRKV